MIYTIQMTPSITIHAYRALSDVPKGNSFRTISSAIGLHNTNMTGPMLAEVYNELADKPVKKFRDRETAVARTWEELVKIKPSNLVEERHDEDSGANPQGTKAKPRGIRNSGYGGHIFVALCSENPRRPGSHGFNSMEIIIDAGKEGISYEDFIVAGGRRQDLAWDLKHDNVEMVK